MDNKQAISWIRHLMSTGENFIEEERQACEMAIEALKKKDRLGKNETYMNPKDEFICSECGFMLTDFTEECIDEDDGEPYYREYEIEFCPHCGTKINMEAE